MTTTADTLAKIATVDEQANVAIVIPMEDEIIHTAENGYKCQDRSCPCWVETRERLPLNGNRPFSLLR